MFNLDTYEQVDERIARFYKEHKNGRIITEMPHYDEEKVVMKALVYKDYEDDKPSATGYAEETRGKGGPVNATAHLENCETSAIGRALANLNYAKVGSRPSKEEMEKVARHTTIVSNKEPAMSERLGVDAPDWRKAKPSQKQIDTAIAKSIYRKTMAKEEEKEVEELLKTKTAGEVSDYLGNKLSFDALVGEDNGQK